MQSGAHELIGAHEFIQFERQQEIWVRLVAAKDVDINVVHKGIIPHRAPTRVGMRCAVPPPLPHPHTDAFSPKRFMGPSNMSQA